MVWFGHDNVPGESERNSNLSSVTWRVHSETRDEFRNINVGVGGSATRKSRLAFAVHDPTFGQIVRRQLNPDLVARDDPDEVLSHPSGNVREHIVPGFELHTKSGVGKCLGNGPFDFKRFFFFAQNVRLVIVY
tara:strand:+ start:2467 stop:2865 length:399 start_codon:yes stop_codon:yes gene_type:complete